MVIPSYNTFVYDPYIYWYRSGNFSQCRLFLFFIILFGCAEQLSLISVHTEYSGYAGDNIFPRISHRSACLFLEDGMRNWLGCLARVLPRSPPLFPACAAIIRTIRIFERISLRTSSLLLLVGTTKLFFFFFLATDEDIDEATAEPLLWLALTDPPCTSTDAAVVLDRAELRGVNRLREDPEVKKILRDQACLCDAYRATGSLIGVLRIFRRDYPQRKKNHNCMWDMRYEVWRMKTNSKKAKHNQRKCCKISCIFITCVSHTPPHQYNQNQTNN